MLWKKREQMRLVDRVDSIIGRMGSELCTAWGRTKRKPAQGPAGADLLCVRICKRSIDVSQSGVTKGESSGRKGQPSQ